MVHGVIGTRVRLDGQGAMRSADVGSAVSSSQLAVCAAVRGVHLRRTQRRRGDPPVPLSQRVLKIHSHCHLACDNCYVYEAVGQSWRRRLWVISPEVAYQAARRQCLATFRCERSRFS